MNMVLEDIKNYQDYYEGLQNSLIPDREILSLAEADDSDYELLQESILNNPNDKGLLENFQHDRSGILLLTFLYLPLWQAMRYAQINCLPELANSPLPPRYTIFDAKSICDELSKITRLGRERIFNFFKDVDFKYSEKLKNAITEPNIELMQELIDGKEVDLVWLQRVLGICRYGRELDEYSLKGKIPEEFGNTLYMELISSTNAEDIPYLDEVIRIRMKDERDVNNSFVLCSLTLKYYWLIHQSFTEKTRYIIDSYISKPCFADFVSKCRAEFEEDERQRGCETAAKEMENEDNEPVNVDNKPVVEEIQSQSTQNTNIAEEDKIFNFSPNDNAINLFPEGETAFDGSKGLADYAINNKEKIERFVHLMVKKFHYIPDDKKQAKAFVRTITGIQFDGGKTKPKLLSDEAVNAILFMAQRGILTGKINQALQKFDFEEGVTFEHEGNWHSTYAKRADIQFKKLVEETFGNYELYKPEKK